MNEIEKAIEYLEACMDGLDPEFDKSVELVSAALRTQLAAQRNDPLTLEELRGMDGEPVWLVGLYSIEYGWRDKWLLIDADEGFAYDGFYKIDLEDCVGLAYRRPPEE